MSFNKQESSVLVNVKLTDTGRRLLSLGQLSYSKAVISDREIDYNIDPTDLYSVTLNRIISPKDDHPILPFVNFDGSQAIDLGQNLFGGTFVSSAYCPSTGFFSASTDTGTTLNVNDYEPNAEFVLAEDEVSASDLNGTNVVGVSSSYFPRAGDLALFVFNNPSSGGQAIDPSAAFVTLWYRITGDSNSFTTDRPLPNFSTGGSPEATRVFHYPWNGISNYYGSGSSVDVKLWNMNIVRSNSEIGTPTGASGYTEYGSREYNGQKHRFGLDDSCRQIGLIHFTNEFTGNTYSEQLAPGATRLDVYNIMWHRHDSGPGEGEQMGHRFLDSGSPVYFDDIANTSYTTLRDGVDDGIPVGRVYQKLKLIVITDPELLNAMSYKSNRNWTLPPLILSHRSTPPTGSSIMSTNGCLKSNKTYYVTYIPMVYNQYWDPMESYGYQPFLHCGYIQKITGYTDSDGNHAYLSARFPQRSFPYMRNLDGMASHLGTGWMCNNISLIMKEVDTDADPGVSKIGSDGWLMPYNSSYDGSPIVDANDLLSYEFVVTQDDFVNSSGYTIHSGHTANIDFISTESTNALNFGNEQFFYGNVTTTTKRVKYKTVFSLQLPQDGFNTSNNPTFNSGINSSVYFTEVGILDDENRLVAVGKFTQPVQKDVDQFIIVQLEMDF